MHITRKRLQLQEPRRDLPCGARDSRVGDRPTGWGQGAGAGEHAAIPRPLLLAVQTPSQTKPALTAENLALGQRLGVLEHSVKLPKLRQREGIGWA